jgi:N-acetylmuramoyl-L-alanine amidase
LLLPLQAFAAGNIDVYVDGKQLSFDSPPIVDNNRTLVPFRYIFEALGAEVSYDAASQTAIGTKDNLTIRLPINESKGYINNNVVQLDVASKMIKNRTLVPLRFIGESLGCEVEAKNSANGMVINITSADTDNEDGEDSSPGNDPIPVASRSLSNLDVQTNDGQFMLELEVEEGKNNSFMLSNPYRMVIDLVDTAWQKADIPNFNGEFVSAIRVAQNQETITRVVLDLNQPVTANLDQQHDKLIITLKPKQVWKPDFNLVVLDAGHGGGDVGAIGYSGAYEKNLVIGITQLVKKGLEDQGFKVIMTRPEDQTRSLAERVEIANQTNAFAFVSIHANTAGSQQATGLEVYTKRGSDHTFAKIMVNSILTQTKQNNRGDKEADFYVIKNTVMPAILIETGFISNPQEEQFLWNETNQENIAQGIVNGIISFKSNYVR